MVRETTGFFGEVFTKNLSIREFLNSDRKVIARCSRKDGSRLQAIIEHLVLSELFRKR